MVTVVDPSGSPEPVFNRSGTTIVEVTGSGTTQMSATAIPSVSGWTIAIVQATDTPQVDQAVTLPDNAEIGDIVEVYNVIGGYPALVFPPAGQSLNSGGQVTIDQSRGRMFRQVGATLWRSMS